MTEHGDHAQHHCPYGHSHGSPQVHEDQHNLKEINKNYFDEHGHRYNDHPEAHELARRLGAAMIKAYPFEEDSTLVLDYACGTGQSCIMKCFIALLRICPSYYRFNLQRTCCTCQMHRGRGHQPEHGWPVQPDRLKPRYTTRGDEGCVLWPHCCPKPTRWNEVWCGCGTSPLAMFHVLTLTVTSVRRRITISLLLKMSRRLLYHIWNQGVRSWSQM